MSSVPMFPTAEADPPGAGGGVPRPNPGAGPAGVTAFPYPSVSTEEPV
ncbi:hypothetical protein [Streptomyces amakusaensis]|uniref:Uncharacterized protein n=1 Tax=Streptomyces amakusaensis TaxID=67271 RepID=A0ABW0AG47_9ACTN